VEPTLRAVHLSQICEFSFQFLPRINQRGSRVARYAIYENNIL